MSKAHAARETEPKSADLPATEPAAEFPTAAAAPVVEPIAQPAGVPVVAETVIAAEVPAQPPAIDGGKLTALHAAIDHGRGLQQDADHIVKVAEKFWAWLVKEDKAA